MELSWNDPNADPLEDLLKAKRLAEEQYEKMWAEGEQLIEETKEVMEDKREKLNMDKAVLGKKELYLRTADPEKVKRRRVKNKIARKSRRKNR